LHGSWSLASPISTAEIAFTDGWYDHTQVTPQITVSDLSSPVGGFFGTRNLQLFHNFTVNCWLQIPRGADGTLEQTQIESMRAEVLRITNSYRASIVSLPLIVPLDEGTPRHETNQTPRILRYEIVVFGVENKS